MSEEGSVIYSIVIPCYCSEPSLPELVNRIRATLQPRGEPFEIILVNDASPDGTWEAIEQLAAEYPFVVGVDMLRNGGQYRSILCGLERVRGRWVILMDDDLQHPPEQLPVLIDAIEQQPDVDCVMGKYRVKHHSMIRNLGSALVSRVDTLLYGKPKNLVGSSFQIMTRQLADALTRHQTVNPILNPLIYRTTQRIRNVPVDHEPRAHGHSGYRFTALVRLVINNVLSASNLPLRLVSILGLCSALGSRGPRQLLSLCLFGSRYATRLRHHRAADHLLRRYDAVGCRTGGRVPDPDPGGSPWTSSLCRSDSNWPSLLASNDQEQLYEECATGRFDSTIAIP